MNLQFLEKIKNVSPYEIDVPDYVDSNHIQLLAQHYPQLRSIILDLPDDEAIECLYLFPNLQKLFINCAHCMTWDGKGFEAIWKLLQLTHIAINQFQDLDESFLQNLCHLRNLIFINLEFCEYLLDENIPIFSNFEKLKYLNLNGSEYLSDKGMESLSSLKHLEGLEIAYAMKISDQGFQFLNRFSQLKYLNLRKTNVSDEILKTLSLLENLECVNLNECSNFTEIGLFALQKLPKLHTLFIGDCPQINQEMIQQLRPSICLNVELNHAKGWKCWNSLIKKYS